MCASAMTLGVTRQLRRCSQCRARSAGEWDSSRRGFSGPDADGAPSCDGRAGSSLLVSRSLCAVLGKVDVIVNHGDWLINEGMVKTTKDATENKPDA